MTSPVLDIGQPLPAPVTTGDHPAIQALHEGIGRHSTLLFFLRAFT